MDLRIEHNILGCDGDEGLDIVVVPISEPESPPISKALRERIDRAREMKRISWFQLEQMMTRWTGKVGFREMTVRDGWVVVRKLEER